MRSMLRPLSVLLDVLLVFSNFYLTYGTSTLLMGHPLFPSGHSMYFKTHLFTTIAWTCAILLVADYPVRRLTRWWADLSVVVRVNVLGVVFFGLLAFFLKQHNFSRAFVALFTLHAALVMWLVRVVVRWILAIFRRAGLDYRTRLVVGDGPSAERYVKQVQEHPELGLRILGWLDDSDAEDLRGIPRVGGVRDLAKYLTILPVDGVVVTLPLSHPELEWVIHHCELQGIPVELVLDDLGTRIRRSELVHNLGMSRLVVSSLPHTSAGLVLKRLTDIVISAVALIVLSPLMALIALAIKLDDGGPVIYSQVRVGLHGRLFKMHKFRSMVVGADKMVDQLRHLNEMSGPVFKLSNDPRITRVGRFLRRTSLDELPQLWDVLVGNMSLVGPRPPLPSEVAEYYLFHRRRLSVRPGITCTWQVSGRNDISDFEEWVRLDLEYIDNWSYWLDWKVLLMTVPAVLARRGAR